MNNLQATLSPVVSFICSQKLSRSVMSDSLRPHGLQPARLLYPWNCPVKNTGVGCHFLLQGIFLTQRSNLQLLHWQAASFPLSHQRSHERKYTQYENNSKVINLFRDYNSVQRNQKQKGWRGGKGFALVFPYYLRSFDTL